MALEVEKIEIPNTVLLLFLMNNIFLVFLFCFATCSSYGQVVFKMRMDVVIVGEEETRCLNDHEVVWGFYNDTLAVDLGFEVIELWPTVVRSESRELVNTFDFIAYMKDDCGDTYLVKIIRNRGVLIYINVIGYKWPHYMLDFTENNPCWTPRGLKQ
jgi:hypothetical protein